MFELKQILGTWLSYHPEGKPIQKTQIHFNENGDLVYTLMGKTKDQVIFLNFRLEGNELITDQPSSPSEERTQIEMPDKNHLILIYQNEKTYYKRVLI